MTRPSLALTAAAFALLASAAAPAHAGFGRDGTAVAGVTGARNGLLTFAVTQDEARYDIYVSTASGKQLRRLTRDGSSNCNGSSNVNPAWSPNGKRIVFSSSRADPCGGSNIYVMDAAGKHVRELTYADSFDSDPAWSPDGKRIVFARVGAGPASIVVMNADGTGAHPIVTSAEQLAMPAWSPDGSRIAYVHFDARASAPTSVGTVSPDGTNPQQLTTEQTANDGTPSWSPDGTKIAFSSNRTGDFEIWVMNADGTAARDITNHPADDRTPAWSPDGRKIAFTSERAEKNRLDIWVMNADGTHPVRVTHHLGRFALDPTWQPLP